MEGKTAVGHYYDPPKNQHLHGGETDIHGRIVWVVSKEEHDGMMARINRLLPE